MFLVVLASTAVVMFVFYLLDWYIMPHFTRGRRFPRGIYEYDPTGEFTYKYQNKEIK